MAIDETLSADEVSTIAHEAYIYSFPMMMGAPRRYWPEQDALDGTWLAPGVTRSS